MLDRICAAVVAKARPLPRSNWFGWLSLISLPLGAHAQHVDVRRARHSSRSLNIIDATARQLDGFPFCNRTLPVILLREYRDLSVLLIPVLLSRAAISCDALFTTPFGRLTRGASEREDPRNRRFWTVYPAPFPRVPDRQIEMIRPSRLRYSLTNIAFWMVCPALLERSYAQTCSARALDGLPGLRHTERGTQGS